MLSFCTTFLLDTMANIWSLKSANNDVNGQKDSLRKSYKPADRLWEISYLNVEHWDIWGASFSLAVRILMEASVSLEHN